MSVSTQKTRWRIIATAVLAGLAGAAASYYVARSATGVNSSSNAIMVVAPYWYKGTWVFDDPAVGLRREPFVAGVPEMIDVLVKDIPDSREGFRLLFSAHPFPGYQKKLSWLRGDSGGNYYRLDEPPLEGWICPAMFKYYKSAPTALYVKAEAQRP
jgi:hypothetical protein